MADDIPSALRQADINIYKCATKAAQLQTVKPIIAYWCMYTQASGCFPPPLYYSVPKRPR